LIWPVLLLSALACTHSESFVAPTNTCVGPFGTGPDVQLTFNVDQDYWPAWTQDGRGILYAFVDAESALPPYHRCLGLLPPAGGTRSWQLCDNRAVRDGIASSYPAFALDSGGRLLVAEATAPTAFGQSPSVTLWLADTARPYARTTLLSLPQTVSGFTVTWLSDIAWTSANTFIALGQQFNSLPHCDACLCSPCPRDSIWGDGGIVLSGTIVGNTATLQAVPGTDSATSYSLAENGTSVIFTRHHDLRLFKVPIDGGTPVPAPVRRTVPDTGSLFTAELAGVSCKGSTCIVANDGVFLTDAYSAPFAPAFPCLRSNPCQLFAGFASATMQLQSISLATGVVQLVQTDVAALSQVYASPKISPVSGDVVVQRGGVWGHLQTYATPGRGNGHLHLLKGVVP
jgi:hypothetical protein